MSIYKENSTDVMYVVYQEGYKGGITIMMDANGLPLTYSDWKKYAINLRIYKGNVMDNIEEGCDKIFRTITFCYCR